MYVAYQVAFTITPREYQTYVSFCLPIMKLMFKNWASQGLFHMEDLAPSVIVVNVDAFHAMFVSTTMQQTSSRATVGVIMVVDGIQSLIAYYEVQILVRKVNRLAKKCESVGNYTPRTATNSSSKLLTILQNVSSSNRVTSRIASLVQFKLGVVDYALHIIDTNPRIRNHPQVMLARHLRDQTDPSHGPKTHSPNTSNFPRLSQRSIKIMPVPRARTTRPPLSAKADQVDKLTELERYQLECVTSVLKMLHMVDFYILIEFVEAMIAIIYTSYMFLVRYFPNHIYYVQLKHSTDADILVTVGHLLFYTALEVLSFMVLCVIFDWELQHLSTIQQLAFVL